MKRINQIFFVLLLLFILPLNAQNVLELQDQLRKAKEDTAKLRLLVEISDICEINEIEKYANQAIKIADNLLEKNIDKQTTLIAKATAINNLGFLYHNYSQAEKAVKQYEKSLSIFEEISDTNGIIMACNNIAILEKDIGHIDVTIEYLDRALALSLKTANQQMLQMSYTNYSSIYARMGMIDKALKYAYKGLEIQDKIGDDHGKGYALNNIASLYYTQKDLKKAEEYFIKSLEKRKKVNDEYGISTVYNNLAIIYDDQNKDSLALMYYNMCLKQREKINNKEGIAQAYSNLGTFYSKKNQLTKTLDYYQKAISIREKIADKEGLSASYQKMAQFLRKQHKYKEAEKYGLMSLKLAEELSFNDDIKASAEELSVIYEKLGNYRKAYEMNRLYTQIKDSLFNKETQKSIIQQQLNYEYNKKKLTDSLEFTKEQEVKDLALAKQEAQLKQEKTQRITLYGGFVIIIAFAGFVYNRFRKSQKQKNIIEIAHHELAEKNKEITDSIHYAKRIQAAILPPDKIVKEYFQDSFILYKPKDIVAGDFYWMESVPGLGNNKPNILFAAADCTGHGVPGAMVSVVCNNGLNRSVREHGLTDPGKILDKTRQIVIAEFEKSEEEVKDGMDIALCSLKYKVESKKLPNTQDSTLKTVATLQYAGANNPLWIVRKSESLKVKSDQGEALSYALSTFNFTLYELKPNKQPIGKFDHPQPYSSHTIELQKGDAIYIFSDGYVDQFGGEKGKKFKTANFKKLLLSIQGEDMDNQKQIINDTFENWKEGLEQLDDVCVIGVKV